MLRLAGMGGLRIGEAVALRLGDVNVLRRQLQITRAVTEVSGRLYVGKPKTSKGRRNVPLPRVVLRRSPNISPPSLPETTGWCSPLPRAA
jgi:integrase